MSSDNRFETEQEGFWAGEFGSEYSRRNVGVDVIAANTQLFARILARTGKLDSVVEFGANIGLNLDALRSLLPHARLAAVEINPDAAGVLRAKPGIEVTEASILEFEPGPPVELALIKGVLIHINPERLPDVYDRLHKASSRYICVAEYYNPTPVEVSYRGHAGRLFKRDFAGDMLDRFPDLRVVDYGFVWRRDAFPQDDLTWFLLEKTPGQGAQSC